jgi:hypothetical protein
MSKKNLKNVLLFLDVNSSGKHMKRSELLGELRKMGGSDQISERKTAEEEDE